MADLRRIGKADLDECPHCEQSLPVTLTHLAIVCPKFNDARTAAHNQIRSVISILRLAYIREETSLRNAPLTDTLNYYETEGGGKIRVSPW